MKKYYNEEFIRIDERFCKGTLDFYGKASPLSQTEQKDFLAKYYKYYKKRYGESVAFCKAVDEEAAKKLADKLTPGYRHVNFTAYRRKMEEKYQGWQFYTDRVKVVKGELRLLDEGKFPVPCAKYEYACGLAKIKFSVKIGEKYYREVPEGLVPTVTGRFIEFRKGCKEIIKLFFAPNGTFCYKDGRSKPYHYDLKKIAPYTFGEWNDIEIDFLKDCFLLRFAGEEHTFYYTNEETPDTIFLSGGMQPIDEWAFRPTYFEDKDGVLHDVFVKAEKNKSEDEILGEAILPYALGTEKNKDYALVLKSKFTAQTECKTILRVDTLDPGGEVFINGKRVVHTDGFQPLHLDISEHVREGINEMEIVVFPRAPEVLYPWHRHDDYYNAWFCGGVELSTCQVDIREPIKVVTQKIHDGKTRFSVALDLGELEVCDYTVSLQKSFPELGEKVLIDKGWATNGRLSCQCTKAVELWTLDNPTLYKVVVELFKGNVRLWKGETETGFRTIEQKEGRLYLNGEKICLKGGLNMQFLPPYDEVPVNHVCPDAWQIVQQALAIKALNGNCLRQHQLGYGTNDKRFASICDKLGVLLIWTTRLIDAAENMLWLPKWRQAADYQAQMKEVINHPSIIMWEGSNELHGNLVHVDRIYDAFVETVKAEDTSRLICPISHLYYGGGIYDCGCQYYSTDGVFDECGNEASSSFGWRDKDVVRSAHTYCLLLGYGSSWQDMATQNWRWQEELFNESEKAYLISEYAIIGRQNPETEEAKVFINKASYELGDESAALGFQFKDEEWALSQAFQALCASEATKQCLKHGADGMLWCCLWGGANNGSYLKPILDFYGYKKLAFYALQEKFQEVVAFNGQADVLFSENYAIKPMISGIKKGEKYTLSIEVVDENGRYVFSERREGKAQSDSEKQADVVLPQLENGYYVIRYTVEV